jgi:ABC-2 type transport system permease protein
MLQLIKNELFKLIRLKKIYLFMGVLLTVQITGILQYKITQAESPLHFINGQSFPLVFLNTLPQLMILFLIIFLSDIIVGECKNGTLKLVLLRPVSRLEILHAKIVSLLIFIATLTGFAILSSYVVGAFTLGWGDHTILSNTTYKTEEGIFLTLQASLLSIVPQLGFGMFVMLLALLSTNTGITAGISLGLLAIYPFIEGIEQINEYFIINQMYNFHLHSIGNITSTATITGFISCLTYIVMFYIGSTIIIKRKNIYL